MTEKTELEKVDVELIPNGEFYNIDPKKQLKPDQYVIVTKQHAQPLITEDYPDQEIGKAIPGKTSRYADSGKFWGIAKVMYDGVETSFFLTSNPSHDEIKLFSETGGEGDQIKVVLFERKWENKKKGTKGLADCLRFEKVE